MAWEGGKMIQSKDKMIQSKDNLYIQLILSFFRLIGIKSELRVFKVNIIDKYSKNAKLNGSVLWDDDFIDDEPQEFIWYIPTNNKYIHDSIALINYIIDNKLIDGDRIIITEVELRKQLIKQSWNEEKINEALAYLLNLDIKMLDNGEETSSFFVHF